MIRIAVCDDQVSDIQRVETFLQDYRQANPDKPFAVETFTQPFVLAERIAQGAMFDVFLLDIYMDGLTGMELAKEIRMRKEPCYIIFLTTSRDYAIDAFSVNAVQYLLKPYSKEAFFSAINRVFIDRMRSAAHFIMVKTSDGVRRIALNEVVYSASQNHWQCIFCSDGSIVKTRMTVDALFSLFGEESAFVRCGQAYIVNYRYVRAITAKDILLERAVKLPMPRGHYRSFKDRYLEYMLQVQTAGT